MCSQHEPHFYCPQELKFYVIGRIWNMKRHRAVRYDHAGDEVTSCPLFLPWKSFMSLFAAALGRTVTVYGTPFTSCVTLCTLGGTVTVRACKTEGKARSDRLSDDSVWNFPWKPSRIPPWAGDGAGGSGGGCLWSAEGALDGFPPQLLFKQHSIIHSPVTLCKLFESRVCLYAHLLLKGGGGCSLANFCLEIAHYDVSLFIFCFVAHNVHKELSRGMITIYSQ